MAACRPGGSAASIGKAGSCVSAEPVGADDGGRAECEARAERERDGPDDRVRQVAELQQQEQHLPTAPGARSRCSVAASCRCTARERAAEHARRRRPAWPALPPPRRPAIAAAAAAAGSAAATAPAPGRRQARPRPAPAAKPQATACGDRGRLRRRPARQRQRPGSHAHTARRARPRHSRRGAACDTWPARTTHRPARHSSAPGSATRPSGRSPIRPAPRKVKPTC